MIKMITASTLEVDEPQVAAEDILAQIEPDKNLLKNSIGIITCSPEFIETGVVQYINDIFPFETVGMTTLACSTNAEEGIDVFSISVYTSDDVEFAIQISEPLSKDNIEKPIRDAYKNALAKLSGDAKLVLPFGPLLSDVSGEKIMDAVHEEAGDVPAFGSMASSSSFDFDKTATLAEGKSYKQSLVLLVMSGNITPRFFISTISDDKITKQKAIITDSDGSLLKEVNGMNLVEYMKTIGLSQGDGIEGSSAIPFIVDYRDGTKPSVRGIYSVNEEGHAFCGGDMPVGGTLAIGTLDPQDIVKTAGEAVDEALNNDNINGILLFPCQARNHLLEMDYLAEMNKVKEKVQDSIPFHLAYSGGEVCPSYDENNKPVNRYHNFSFIICVL